MFIYRPPLIDSLIAGLAITNLFGAVAKKRQPLAASEVATVEEEEKVEQEVVEVEEVEEEEEEVEEEQTNEIYMHIS